MQEIYISNELHAAMMERVNSELAKAKASRSEIADLWVGFNDYWDINIYISELDTGVDVAGATEAELDEIYGDVTATAYPLINTELHKVSLSIFTGAGVTLIDGE